MPCHGDYLLNPAHASFDVFPDVESRYTNDVSNRPPELALMRDTHLAAEIVRLMAVRRMEPAARLRQAFELSEWARSLALAGLKERHPDCSEFELIEILLGTRLLPAASPRVRP